MNRTVARKVHSHPSALIPPAFAEKIFRTRKGPIRLRVVASVEPLLLISSLPLSRNRSFDTSYALSAKVLRNRLLKGPALRTALHANIVLGSPLDLCSLHAIAYRRRYLPLSSDYAWSIVLAKVCFGQSNAITST